jgi:uncharacterized phage protein (TIGR01671 family)
MKEHIIRGKRKDTGEWVYGYYVMADDTRYIFTGKTGFSQAAPGHVLMYRDFVRFEVVPETAGEYTSLKDNNGVKIFEGDIVQFTYWWFDGYENDSILTGEIIYLPRFMSFGLRGVKNADWIRHIGGEEGSSDTVPFAVLAFDEADFEVIGNIHDNKNFLESNNA